MNGRIERKLPMNATKTAHTPGATRAARIIHGNRYDPPGHANIRQCHTCNDLAEIIDCETKAPQMLEALEDLLGDLPSVQGGICQRCGRDYAGEILSGDCPSDDCPSFKARAAIRAAKGEL